MDSYRDVILSKQPPTGVAQPQAAAMRFERPMAPPQQAGAAAAAPIVTLENFKGVLLADRPTNLHYGPYGGESGAEPGRVAVRVGGVAPPPFVPGGAVGGVVGLPPSTEMMAEAARHQEARRENARRKHSTANVALTRHRRWLRSFAAQMKVMKEEEVQRVVREAEAASRLRDRETLRRSDRLQPAASSVTSSSSGWGGAAAENPTGAPPSSSAHEVMRGGPPPAAKKRKPKWAMTEEEAFDDEFGAHGDLLRFAQSLDYEKFISDFEIAEALSVMRDRVREIAKENNWDSAYVRQAASSDDSECGSVDGTESIISECPSNAPTEVREAHAARVATRAEKQLRRLSHARHATQVTVVPAAQQAEWNKSTKVVGAVLRKAISDDAMALADRILQNSSSMQKIHTRHSLARLLQRCVLENSDGTGAAIKVAVDMGSVGQPLPPIRVSYVSPNATGADANAGVQRGAQLPGTASADDPAEDGTPDRVLLQLQRSKDRVQGLPYLYRCPAL